MNGSTVLRAPLRVISTWFPHHLLPPIKLSLLSLHLQQYLLQRTEERRLCMSPFLGTSDPLQYMDWCDVVTVGCLDSPHLIQVHYFCCGIELISSCIVTATICDTPAGIPTILQTTSLVLQSWPGVQDCDSSIPSGTGQQLASWSIATQCMAVGERSQVRGGSSSHRVSQHSTPPRPSQEYIYCHWGNCLYINSVCVGGGEYYHTLGQMSHCYMSCDFLHRQSLQWYMG